MHYAFVKAYAKGREKNDESSNVSNRKYIFLRYRRDSSPPLAFSEILCSPFTNDTFQSIDVLADVTNG